jgi:AcrR family transcriptional regulator
MRADARANREKILDAARELFIERGVEVDVREICERAGVGMGTLYRHFPTKEELVDEIVNAVATDLRGIMDRFDRRENTRAPIAEWLAFHERYGLIGREIHARFARGFDLELGDNDPFASLRERRLEQWDELQRRGSVRTDIPARFLMEASDGFLGIYLDLRRRWDPEQTQDWLASIFADGTRIPPSERRRAP